MSFTAARAYLLGTINETSLQLHPHRLERTRAILRALGNPQDRYPTLHVGGTSGKGSTATMLAAALTASGKRTGLHTKPHLGSLTERMRVDGLPIGEEALAELLNEIRPAIDRCAAEFGRATYHETLLLLSFLYFAREAVDVAVVEVGMGGTLDATNVLSPKVSIVTNVGLERSVLRRERLEDIALDKAGIAKRGVPLVSDVDNPVSRRQIEERCALAGATFLSVRDLVGVDTQPGEPYGQHFTLRTPQDSYDISLPVLGRFQQRNAATATLALEQLPAALRPPRADIETAMSTLVLAGRMEFFPSFPSVVFDIADNPDEHRHLVDALLETFGERRFWPVVAIGETKDAKGIVEQLTRLPATFVFTTFETTGRASIRPARLASMAGDFGASARAVTDAVEAFSIARRNAAGKDIVLVTGSAYLVGTLRDWWFANVAAGTR